MRANKIPKNWDKYATIQRFAYILLQQKFVWICNSKVISKFLHLSPLQVMDKWLYNKKFSDVAFDLRNDPRTSAC